MPGRDNARENLGHKINITKLLKRLLQKYSGLKVLYKTFPGIDSSNDPLMEIFSEELDQGRVGKVGFENQGRVLGHDS